MQVLFSRMSIGSHIMRAKKKPVSLDVEPYGPEIAHIQKGYAETVEHNVLPLYFRCHAGILKKKYDFFRRVLPGRP